MGKGELLVEFWSREISLYNNNFIIFLISDNSEFWLVVILVDANWLLFELPGGDPLHWFPVYWLVGLKLDIEFDAPGWF